MNESILSCQGIRKTFQDGEKKICPVNGITLNIYSSSFTSVIGRSGSGKSTLLKVLSGLLRPEEGNVVLYGQDLYQMKAKALADFRCHKIGFVFQDYFLEEKYTVEQNLEIPLMLARIPRKDRSLRIEEVLDMVGLEEKKTSLTEGLSGGEKQRVSIARALINRPEILFADEPCGNLDSENSERIMKLFRRICDEGKTVLLITHNLSDANNTDRIIHLQDGKVIKDEVF